MTAKMANSPNPLILKSLNKKNKILVFIRASDEVVCDRFSFLLDFFDCHLSFYNYSGKNPPSDDRWSYSVGGWSKYHAFYKLIELDKHFLDYEYYWFLDEDIIINQDDAEGLMRRILQGGFNVSQLALCAKSHTKWAILYQQKGEGNRNVDFIEVMAPIFKAEALHQIMKMFPKSLSTWGLDHYWSKHLRNLVVFDDITMSHFSRPDTTDGSYYRYLKSIGIDPYFENLKLRFYANFKL